MKMHFAIAAVLAGLSSRAAFADPEADFWQQPGPKSFAHSVQSPAAVPAANSCNLQRGNEGAFDGSPVGRDVGQSKEAPADLPVHDVRVPIAPDSPNGAR
jgi:hypothetical protein